MSSALGRSVRGLATLVSWLAVALAFMAGCAKLPEVHVVGDRDYPPYESCEPGDDSRAEGILVEQWRLMGSKAGLRIKYTCDKWESAQKAVLDGRADAIGGMVKSESRQRDYRFVKQLALNPTHFYYRKPSSELSFAEIVVEGRAVGVVAGDYAIERLEREFPSVLFNRYGSYGDVVVAAKNFEINIFVMEEAVAANLLAKHNINHLFTRNPKPLFQESLWVAVRKENAALAKKLEEGFSRVSDDELAELEQKPKPPRGLLANALRRAEDWARDNPSTTALGTLGAIYVLAIGGMFVFAPLQMFRFSVWLRRLKIQAPSGLFDFAPLRIVSLIWLIDTKSHVLDAWLADRRPVILRNFAGRKTVGDRKSHYLLPFVINGGRVEIPSVQERSRHLVTHLRSVFTKPGACVTIIGEGGSGKTSLACWVARHALQECLDDPNERIFAKLTVPIMLEGQLAQQLVDAIHTQLIGLVEQEVPQEIVTALMRKGRMLVIVDGLSELDNASRERLEATGPLVPRVPLIVTFRRETSIFGGIAKTELRPLRVSRTVLTGFLDFLMREAGTNTKVADVDFFESCARLSKLVGGQEISPLLVVLYAQLLARGNNEGVDPLSHVTSVPDIFSEFVNRLNGALKSDRVSDAVVHGHLRAIAWDCVSTEYRPQPRLRAEILRLIEDRETVLKYLEDRLGVIEAIKPAQTHLRFVLDPLAEYLAAAYLCTEGVVTGELGTFLHYVYKQDKNAATCLGLCRAVVDTAFAKTAVSEATIGQENFHSLIALRAWLQGPAVAEDGANLDPRRRAPIPTNHPQRSL